MGNLIVSSRTAKDNTTEALNEYLCRAWKQNGRDPSYTRDNSHFGHNIGTTAGVGIRLNTPIGPLRFDFGWPVGNKMDDDGMKFYFNMGQSF